MKVFVIGDSHAYNGWKDVRDSVPRIQIHIRHLGPKLMYSLQEKDLSFVQRENISSGDTLVFCFGEIDTRCHIHKYADNMSEVIFNMVKKYFYTIYEITKNFKGIKIGIYFVPPAVQSEGLIDNPDYPYLGSNKDRKTYVFCMNEILQMFCKEFNYLFIDLTKDYSDEDGFLRRDMSDDGSSY